MGCSFLTETGSDAGTVQEETAAAAETAVDVCLGLKRNAQLWQDVAPRFQRARAMGPLLGCLLPRVLAGQLQSLAPEIMQARAGPFLHWRLADIMDARSVCKVALLEHDRFRKGPQHLLQPAAA